jgi:hypothetical protein
MKTYKRLNCIFSCMKRRCYDAKNPSFNNYGARHITICKEWYTPGSHKGWRNFKEWALSNGYADNLTIDRIDNNKGYSPENCRWVTMKVQCNNTRRNRMITYNGKTQTLSQWCDELGLDFELVRTRFYRHDWGIEKIFEVKKRPRYKMITYKGKTQSLKDWCKELDLNYRIVQSRLYRGWPVCKAFCKQDY